MTSETQPKPKKRYPIGSPYISRGGNAIFFTICGQSWVVGIPQVFKLIKGKNRFHYLNPPPRESKRGTTFQEKLTLISTYHARRKEKEQIIPYKGHSTLSGKILEEAGYGQQTTKE